MCLSIPALLISTEGDDPLSRTGLVELGGVRKSISLAYVPDVMPGQYVLVHVGFAISVIDEAEAQFLFHYLENYAFAPETAATLNAISDANPSPSNERAPHET